MNHLLTALNDWIGREVVWRVYRLLGGAPMARQNLLLRTRGRKTGKQRTAILTYLRTKATWLVVASNGGESVDARLVSQPPGASTGRNPGGKTAFPGGGRASVIGGVRATVGCLAQAAPSV